jgi:8-oxo-dGTP diphosphatase
LPIKRPAKVNVLKNYQGIHWNHYKVIPRVLILLFNEGNTEVLLIKRSLKKKIWPGFFNGLGGHVEKGEDILTAAHRELSEESGLERIKLTMVGTVTMDVEKNVGVLIFLFKGTCRARKFNKNQEGYLKWIKIKEMKKVHSIPDLPFFIDLCLKWKPGDTVYHLKSSYEDGGVVVRGSNINS